MIIRYHWGLGIGHTYSHGQGTSRIPATSAQASEITTCAADVNPQPLYDGDGTADINPQPLYDGDGSVGVNPRPLDEGKDLADIDSQLLDDGNNSDVDNPEFDLENREDDLGEDSEGEDEPQVDFNDDELLAMDDMYGVVGMYDDYYD